MLGSLTSPGTSAVIGGLSSLAGAALLAVTVPALRTYRTDEELVVLPEPEATLTPQELT